MRLLLDTHVVLWAAAEPERLGSSVELVLSAEERWVSAASAWELAIKQGLGRVSLGAPVSAWVRRTAAALRAGHLPVTHEHAGAVEHLPALHRDPFDRLLVAQAQHEGLLLLTADATLAGYGPAVRLVRPPH